MTRIGQAIHAVFGCYLRRSWKKVLLSHGDLPIEVYECHHCDKKWLKYSDCSGYQWRLINGEYCKELREAVTEREDTVMVRKGSNSPPPGNKPKPPANPPRPVCPQCGVGFCGTAGGYPCTQRQIAKPKRQLAAMTKERDDYKRSFDAMPDKGEKGMGCTLVDAILCHLDVFVDTDERFWELARVADAGHTRQIQHIVMRAFIRMVEEADRADKLLSVGSKVLYGKTELDRQNAMCNMTTVVDEYNAKLEGDSDE